MDSGPLADFRLTAKDRYELYLAALLHDCGKVTAPVLVVDMAITLQPLIDARFELLRRDAEVRKWRSLAEGRPADEAERDYAEFCGQLDADEVLNLTIRAGTLIAAEREIINHHIVATICMLEQQPWPKHLQDVPECAGWHHERMDGKGYPKGLKREEMSWQARMMSIADIFEALTAKDRPYKPATKLSQARKSWRTSATTATSTPISSMFLSIGRFIAAMPKPGSMRGRWTAEGEGLTKFVQSG